MGERVVKMIQNLSGQMKFGKHYAQIWQTLTEIDRRIFRQILALASKSMVKLNPNKTSFR